MQAVELITSWMVFFNPEDADADADLTTQQ